MGDDGWLRVLSFIMDYLEEKAPHWKLRNIRDAYLTDVIFRLQGGGSKRGLSTSVEVFTCKSAPDVRNLLVGAPEVDLRNFQLAACRKQ